MSSSFQLVELIRACAESDDAEAWQAFVAASQRQISLSVIRTLRRWGGFQPDVVDDLVQESYLKLCAGGCRQLRRFSSAHPNEVDGYIKTVAINVAHDYLKSKRSQKRGCGEIMQFPENLEVRARTDSPGSEQEIQRTILLQQIDNCLDVCTKGTSKSRDRLIFWLHFRHGMSANAIAALPAIGLTPKGVESAIQRLTGQVRVRLVTFWSEEPEEPVEPRPIPGTVPAQSLEMGQGRQ